MSLPTSDPRPNPPVDPVDSHRLKLIEYLTKRLEQTLSHTHNSTKLIYIVNGAVIAFVYFELGIVKPLWVSLALAAFFVVLLVVINYLHANFIKTQQVWYRTIDEQIWELFQALSGFKGSCPPYIGRRYWDAITKCAETRLGSRWPCKRTHQVYMWIHLAVAAFLFALFVGLICAAISAAQGEPWVWFNPEDRPKPASTARGELPSVGP